MQAAFLLPKTDCGHWAGMAAITLGFYAALSALDLPDHQPATAEKPISDFYISPYGSDFNPGKKQAPFLSFKIADSAIHGWRNWACATRRATTDSGLCRTEAGRTECAGKVELL
jgi:hypothetical protein